MTNPKQFYFKISLIVAIFIAAFLPAGLSATGCNSYGFQGSSMNPNPATSPNSFTVSCTYDTPGLDCIALDVPSGTSCAWTDSSGQTANFSCTAGANGGKVSCRTFTKDEWPISVSNCCASKNEIGNISSNSATIISGYIKESSGAVISGATVTAADRCYVGPKPSPITIITTSSGYYSISLPSGWSSCENDPLYNSVEVSASKTGCTFSPASADAFLTGGNVNQNFTGACQTSCSVNISANPNPVSSGQATGITWSSTNVSGLCTTSGGSVGWSVGAKNPSGSWPSQALTQSSTYTLTCQNSAGTQCSNSVTVNIGASSLLTVTKAGIGSGTVTSAPTGINCGSDCTENYTSGTSVTLTAAPASGSTFAGWSGCDSITVVPPNQTCNLTMNAAKNVTAIFTIGTACVDSDNGKNYNIKGFTTGVTRCVDQSACNVPYTVWDECAICDPNCHPSNTNLWEYFCDIDGKVSVEPNHNCPNGCSDGACISGQNYLLTVTKAGIGSGTVTSAPTGINCGSDCTENYTSGTSVTLTAAPASGSTFAGWSGDCTDSTGGPLGSKTNPIPMNKPNSFSTTTYYASTAIGSPAPSSTLLAADQKTWFVVDTAVMGQTIKRFYWTTQGFNNVGLVYTKVVQDMAGNDLSAEVGLLNNTGDTNDQMNNNQPYNFGTTKFLYSIQSIGRSFTLDVLVNFIPSSSPSPPSGSLGSKTNPIKFNQQTYGGGVYIPEGYTADGSGRGTVYVRAGEKIYYELDPVGLGISVGKFKIQAVFFSGAGAVCELTQDRVTGEYSPEVCRGYTGYMKIITIADKKFLFAIDNSGTDGGASDAIWVIIPFVP